MLLGFSIRGPLCVVTPSVGIAVFYLFQLQWKKLLVYGMASLALLVALWLLLLQLANAAGGEVFMTEVIRQEQNLPLVFTGRPRIQWGSFML